MKTIPLEKYKPCEHCGAALTPQGGRCAECKRLAQLENKRRNRRKWAVAGSTDAESESLMSDTPKKSHKPAKPSLAASARVMLIADFAAACDRHDYATARKLADEAEKMGKPLSAGMLKRIPALPRQSPR